MYLSDSILLISVTICVILLINENVMLINGIVIETDDTVVIEAEPRAKRQSRQAGLPVSATWNDVLGEGSPCVTSKGHLGSCTSFRNCYPYFKLPDLSIWEAWVLGNYDTCSFYNKEGRQAFGVCCSNPITTTAPLESDSFEVSPPSTIRPHKDNNYPNWPPPIPTHPPDHSAPTHPAISGSWPGGIVTTTSTTYRPITTWPTKPPKPSKPTHSTAFPNWPTYPNPVFTTTLSPLDNEIPVDGSCGAKNGLADQERIVGGHNADPNEWPWIAVLFNSGRQFCGGSLIDNIHILTAAHCVVHMTSWDVARLTVRLADHNIKSNTEVQHIEKRIKRVVRHRGFDSRTLYNDIAILTMDSPVTFSRTVKPICLPTSTSRVFNGQSATVIGWGSLRENGPQPAILQEVMIPIWGNSECRIKYGAAAPGGIIDSMVCAGKAAKDSCSGDSGGPLMVNEGRWTQVGIVSWGIGCGKGQYPGVYTRVSHFIPWITKNLKDKR